MCTYLNSEGGGSKHTLPILELFFDETYIRIFKIHWNLIDKLFLGFEFKMYGLSLNFVFA